MVKAGSAFYVMTINPLAGPTAGTPYKVIAYFPDYDGGLSQLSLPYREKIPGTFQGGALQVINYGTNPSTLPNERNPPASPFPTSALFRFILDANLAQQPSSATPTVVGFGQVSESGPLVTNITVYSIAKANQLIVKNLNFEATVQYVATNGNQPELR